MSEHKGHFYSAQRHDRSSGKAHHLLASAEQHGVSATGKKPSYAKGGFVPTGGAESGIGRLEAAESMRAHGHKGRKRIARARGGKTPKISIHIHKGQPGVPSAPGVGAAGSPVAGGPAAAPMMPPPGMPMGGPAMAPGMPPGLPGPQGMPGQPPGGAPGPGAMNPQMIAQLMAQRGMR